MTEFLYGEQCKPIAQVAFLGSCILHEPSMRIYIIIRSPFLRVFSTTVVLDRQTQQPPLGQIRRITVVRLKAVSRTLKSRVNFIGPAFCLRQLSSYSDTATMKYLALALALVFVGAQGQPAAA